MKQLQMIVATMIAGALLIHGLAYLFGTSPLVIVGVSVVAFIVCFGTAVSNTE